MIKADIAVIGGGASGITAAITAKYTSPDAKVIIAERLDRIGKKILSTGNGRCNLSNKDLSEKHFHGTFKNVSDMIRNNTSAESFFKNLGVPCTADSEGRIYPRSNSAATVLSALRMTLLDLGINEICGFEAVDIIKSSGNYVIRSASDEEISAKRIIIAAGGYAAPSCGTDGSFTRFLRSKGYEITPVSPAVAPLRVSPESVKGLKGVRVKGKISAYSGGKHLRTEQGEIQFTENSVSGICVFNLAYLYQNHEKDMTLRAELSDMSESELTGYMKNIRKLRGKHSIEEFLTGLFTKNLAVYLVKHSLHRPLNELVESITDAEINMLIKNIKSIEFKVTGSASWQQAQSTMGGVSSRNVDEKLCSKTDKGIYLCGEILDVAGDCGGYNLQWAWTSGIIAGKNAALSLKGAK